MVDLGCLMDHLLDIARVARAEYTTPIAWYTTAVGIVTSVAGYIMAAGFWPWA